MTTTRIARTDCLEIRWHGDPSWPGVLSGRAFVVNKSASLICGVLLALALGASAALAAGAADSAKLEADGDALMAKGDAAGARALYEKRAAALRQLLAAKQLPPAQLTDFMVTLTQLHEVDMQLGDADSAVKSDTEQLDIARRVETACRKCPDGTALVIVAYNELGDSYTKKGDTDKALSTYKQGLDIARQMLAAQPAVASLQDQLSTSLDKMGDLLLGAGKPRDARPYLQESLGYRRSLARAQPNSGSIQRDLVSTLMAMAQATNDPAYPREALTVVLAMQKRGILAPQDVWMIDDLHKTVGQ